ncbi:MAG TPA: MBL fold metallo-hydrolase [Pyrinomonadaceae bacterium]|jgi:L-ascorbate metabolism protein UlaG (beta-lactamase superfamily)
MAVEKVYLRQNVKVEPLFNQWYAWSCLVAPATAAMYVANSHLKIMQSFVASPQIHASALKNPAMRGGPFINYDVSRVADVKALMERTTRASAPLLEFAKGVQAVNELLSNEGDGSSLEPLYSKVPEALRGYVELVYDLNNNPSARFIEGLLYKSPYYDESLQSVALSLVEEDERPFALSTPSLKRGDSLHLNIPFRAEELAQLFAMKDAPQPLDYVKELLRVSKEDEELFASFFTAEAPPPRERYAGKGVRVRYFNHACVLIESAEASVLIDPLVSYSYPSDIPRYTFADLPETIDYVVITHNHQDHCVFETLLQLRHKTRNVIVPKNNGGGLADPSLKLVLQNIGFRNVRELDEMETFEIEGGGITGLPFLGEHADLNIKTKMAHLVELDGQTVLCCADSNNIEPRLYDHIHRQVGDVDALFLGMECDGGPLSWLYGPLMTKPIPRKIDHSRRLDGSDYGKGIGIVEKLNPGQVYVYAMGQEPWLTFLTSIQYTDESHPIVESDKLVADCRGRGIVSERLYGQKEIFLGGELGASATR